MHEIIRDHLEEHLRSTAASSRLLEFHAHLAECGECRDAVVRMGETAIQVGARYGMARISSSPQAFLRA